MDDRRVAITGMGLVTPLGTSPEDAWLRVLGNETGIAYHPRPGRPSRLSYYGEVVEVTLPNDIPPKLSVQVRFLNRGSLLGLLAAHQAIGDSQIDLRAVPAHRRGLYMGTGDHTKVGYEFIFPATYKATAGQFQYLDPHLLNRAMLQDVSPFYVLESMHNNLFSFLSAVFDLKGPNASLASLSPCGAEAIQLGWRAIMQGKADCALVLGCGNWITEIPLYELECLGLLSRCLQGSFSYRPFDARRDGFIPGEGGAALLLEDMDHACGRGARIVAQIVGSASGIEIPGLQDIGISANRTRQIMEKALVASGLNPADLAFMILHGNGTRKGDGAELRAVQSLLGSSSKLVPLVGLKPYSGHLGAASDIVEIILGIKAAQEGVVPGTLNFRTPEKDFVDLRISASHQVCAGKHFLTASRGMGGQVSVLMIETN